MAPAPLHAPLHAPLLGPADLADLRDALEEFTADSVAELLGPVGRAAHSRGDLAGVARAVRPHGDDPLATLVRLFLLGADVDAAACATALRPLPLVSAEAAGLVQRDGDVVRPLLEIRPYQEAESDDPWWVVSDFGSDVRPGALAADHVLGIGGAALTLAQATPRTAVGRALDVGTGCGVQALHLGRHAEHVTATDISARALRFAATSAALSGQDWRLREGSLLDPVADERFDLVVANPPFVVSPGETEYEYRDSGMAGDAVCRTLVRSLPGVLAPGGTAQLLANWIVPADGSWQERVGHWFAGSGCCAWVWQREVADLAEYVALWLRDAGLVPGTVQWSARYDAWLDWFAGHGVAAVGMGLITMQDTGGAGSGDAGHVVFDDVPQPVAQPIGPELAAWFDRHRHLDRTSGAELLRGRYRPADDLTRTRDDLLTVTEGQSQGWTTRRARLRQLHGMRWELDVDDTVAGIVAACAAGGTPLLALEMLATAGSNGAVGADGTDLTELGRAFEPVLRNLVQRGVLLPEPS